MREKSPQEKAREKKARDPRIWQITALTSLLVYGLVFLRLELRPTVVLAIFATALPLQALAGRLVGLPRIELKSALISSLSLCLLLRTSSPTLAALVASITILSKFLLRARGKHIFNPTNFGLVAGLLLVDGVWVSPGQWGAVAFFGFALASLGVFVVHRSRRGDVTWAFLVAWSALLFGRALWLGDPLSIPLHQLQSGALLIFAFFMISDPKTTPDHRLGRILWAALVAGVAAYLQFELFETNALLFALVLSAPLVPLIDRLLPSARFAWKRAEPSPPEKSPAEKPSETTIHPTDQPSPRSPDMNPVPCLQSSTESLAPGGRRARIAVLLILLASVLLLFAAPSATAFCGFYVAKAESDFYNQASKVVIVRDGERTVLTMVNDYQGDPQEFAVVIPVPTKLEREQINVGRQAVIDHLDAYTAPRLVEYFDADPCRLAERKRVFELEMQDAAPAAAAAKQRAASLGVRIEASYSIGEYDIQILSAEESQGLATWLREEGYRLPDGAEPVLRSYLKQGLRFFVAKVNLEARERLGFSQLRPLQMAFETPRFGLPIRLGTLNADGPQELFVWILTRTGRVETANYRSVRLPTDAEIPEFVEGEFGDFYRALFAHQAEKERRRVVFLEYAWDMGWCDPCAADPLSNEQLRELGVFWLGESFEGRGSRRMPRGQDVFVTRLHLSYTAETFPEDLVFQETGDRTNFQGRYILRRPWTGDVRTCPAAGRYYENLRQRREQRAQRLSRLTGWDIGEIRHKMELGAPPESESESWWKRLWN